MAGIQSIKDTLRFALKMQKTITEALSDKKINFAEGWAISWQALGLVEIIKKSKDTWAEMQDLDDLELQDLRAMVRDEFDIPNDKIEETIEMSLDLLMRQGDFAIKMQKIWGKDK